MNSNESNHQPEEQYQGCRHRGGKKRFLKIPIFVAAFVLLKSVVTMYLWNALVPDLFNGPVISFVQSIELVVLAKVLIGFGGRGPMGGRMMRHRVAHQFAHLSPEDREKLRQELGKK